MVGGMGCVTQWSDLRAIYHWSVFACTPVTHIWVKRIAGNNHIVVMHF